MSEMTLEQSRELVYGIRTNIESTKKGLPDDYQDWAEEVVSDLTHAIDSLAHLSRAPVQVTDKIVRHVAECLQFKGWATGGDFEDEFLPDVRAALESARLAQPVVVNGLTSDQFGEWCNTLTHAYMYVNERSLENAKHGIELVLDDLREWQEKLSQPHPQAAQGDGSVCFTDNGEDIERRMAEHAENACPCCGGSGHKDDAQGELSGNSGVLEAQGGEAQREAVPAYWAAISDDGEIVVAYPADDGNGGEAARAECNQYINDALVNDRELLHLVPLYTHPAERAAVPEEVIELLRDLSVYRSSRYKAVLNAFGNRAKALLDSLSAAPTLAGKGSYQQRVADWMQQAFIPSLYSNMTERGDRLLEEVLELLQAHGYDQARVATLVQYVFGRPAGEPAQEVGGVMVTLAGYCFIAGLDMHAAGEAELARIGRPEVMAKIRAKQEAKNALHFDTPLPGLAVGPEQ